MVLNKRQTEEFQLLTDLKKQVDFCREMLETSTTEEHKKIFGRQLEQAKKALNDFIDDKIFE